MAKYGKTNSVKCKILENCKHIAYKVVRETSVCQQRLEVNKAKMKMFVA